jgi:hypothetical protein
MDALMYFQNAHTFNFTLTTLTKLLNKNDFQLIKGNEQIQSIFSEVKSIKRTLVFDNSEYSEVSKYLKRMEKNRFIYHFKFTTNLKRLEIILKRVGRKLKFLNDKV